MRLNGIVGIHKRRRGCTRRDPDAPPATTWSIASSHLRGQIGYGSRTSPSIQTAEGTVYLAVVVDAWSRRVIGWSIADHIRAELVVDALQMAMWRRRPPAGQTVHHSDHGAQGSTRAGRSDGGCAPPACSARWARSATPTTTRWPSRSCRCCSVSYSTNSAGRPAASSPSPCRMDRSLVQPAPPAHLDRVTQPDRVRGRPSRRTARASGMSPTGSRNRARRCLQRPATTAGGINTPDDPSLCGPSPTRTRTVRESGGRSFHVAHRSTVVDVPFASAVASPAEHPQRASSNAQLPGPPWRRQDAVPPAPAGSSRDVRISASSNVRWAAFGGIREAPDRTRASTTSSSMNDPPAATRGSPAPGGRLVNPVL